MYFDIIASGSKGNATLVKHNNTLILIDLGITLTRLNEALDSLHLSLKDIDAAIFTHEHSDHLNGLKCISPKKMYALEGTLPSSLSNVINKYEPFIIKDIKITAFPVSHDAKNPCGYILESKKEKLVYMTDTGIFLDESLPYISNPDYLIIESNHDIQMEMRTHRSFRLKQRILGEFGHLCNEDSAFASIEILGDKTKEIVLAHLSEEANTPEVALEAYQKVFSYKGLDITKYHVHCASQYIATMGGKYED
ncbi:MAG: MBL fold metallo-hydrolase [Bacilli bacterium]|nr:MBL fold metallo-hydrolase [Bacilli bacterium]